MNKKELAALALRERRMGRDPSRALAAAIGEFDRYSGSDIETIVINYANANGHSSWGASGGTTSGGVTFSGDNPDWAAREVAAELAFMVGEIKTQETTEKIKLMAAERFEVREAAMPPQREANPGPMPEWAKPGYKP